MLEFCLKNNNGIEITDTGSVCALDNSYRIEPKELRHWMWWHVHMFTTIFSPTADVQSQPIFCDSFVSLFLLTMVSEKRMFENCLVIL